MPISYVFLAVAIFLVAYMCWPSVRHTRSRSWYSQQQIQLCALLCVGGLTEGTKLFFSWDSHELIKIFWAVFLIGIFLAPVFRAPEETENKASRLLDR